MPFEIQDWIYAVLLPSYLYLNQGLICQIFYKCLILSTNKTHLLNTQHTLLPKVVVWYEANTMGEWVLPGLQALCGSFGTAFLKVPGARQAPQLWSIVIEPLASLSSQMENPNSGLCFTHAIVKVVRQSFLKDRKATWKPLDVSRHLTEAFRGLGTLKSGWTLMGCGEEVVLYFYS